MVLKLLGYFLIDCISFYLQYLIILNTEVNLGNHCVPSNDYYKKHVEQSKYITLKPLNRPKPFNRKRAKHVLTKIEQRISIDASNTRRTR